MRYLTKSFVSYYKRINFKKRVKLFFCPKPYQMKFVTIQQVQKYNEKIVPLLTRLATQKLSNQEIFNILNKFQIFASMLREKKQYHESNFRLKNLEILYAKQLPEIFSNIARTVLDCKEKLDFDILTSKKEGQIIFNKKQIVYLMSLMTLGLIPKQKYDSSQKLRRRFPYSNQFDYIFQEQQYKTRTIIEYFKDYFNDKSQTKDEFNFTIKRFVLNQDIQNVIKSKAKQPMTQFQITLDDVSIEDKKFIGQGKVDFANKYIGGGALHSGCVQQQIMFANHPQLFTTVLFCEMMQPNQALLLTGYKKYSKNKGYGWNTEYHKQQDQKQLNYQKDEKNRANEYIIAVDAIHYGGPKYPVTSQCSEKMINRQLTKAYIGFSVPQKIDIVTGNWGCGAFRGQIRIKFLIQWLACSLAGKKMVYCPFGSRNTLKKNQKILVELSKKTIGQVYNALIEAKLQKMDPSKINIFELINQLK